MSFLAFLSLFLVFLAPLSASAVTVTPLHDVLLNSFEVSVVAQAGSEGVENQIAVYLGSGGDVPVTSELEKNASLHGLIEQMALDEKAKHGSVRTQRGAGGMALYHRWRLLVHQSPRDEQRVAKDHLEGNRFIQDWAENLLPTNEESVGPYYVSIQYNLGLDQKIHLNASIDQSLRIPPRVMKDLGGGHDSQFQYGSKTIHLNLNEKNEVLISFVGPSQPEQKIPFQTLQASALIVIPLMMYSTESMSLLQAAQAAWKLHRADELKFLSQEFAQKKDGAIRDGAAIAFFVSDFEVFQDPKRIAYFLHKGESTPNENLALTAHAYLAERLAKAATSVSSSESAPIGIQESVTLAR